MQLESLFNFLVISGSLTSAVVILKDLILVVCAVCGSIVAWRGLSTWQRQLKGQTEYALTRNILGRMFKYRDAIAMVRHPAVFLHEVALTEEEAKDLTPERRQYQGKVKSYENRWKAVRTIRSELYPDLIEAEALWGEKYKDAFQPLFKLEWELETAINRLLRASDPDVDPEVRESVQKIMADRRDILYEVMGDDPDEFKNDLKAQMKIIEGLLRKKLANG